MCFLAIVSAAIRLDVDVGHHFAQIIAQSPFYLASDVMRLGYGEVAIYLDMDIDHAQVAVGRQALG